MRLCFINIRQQTEWHSSGDTKKEETANRLEAKLLADLLFLFIRLIDFICRLPKVLWNTRVS